ncbi:MAG: pyridoxamine 5'-phosphate oxidase family protein [Chloroflexota bacterium]
MIDPTKLALVRELAGADGGRAVLATARADGSVQASVVTAGVAEHPISRLPMVAFVCRGNAVKLRNLRRDPRGTIVFRSGGRWVTVEGATSIIGPDDPADGFDLGALPTLLRDVFTAIGGTHDDWSAYDRVMAEERRAAVFLELERVYTNPGR